MKKKIERKTIVKIAVIAIIGACILMSLPATAQTWGSDHTSNTSYRVLIDNDGNAGDEVFAVWHDGTNGEELMRIQENGNVGIGTSIPNALLEVNGTIGIESDLHASELSGRLRYTENGTWQTGKLHLGINGGVGIGIFDAMTIDYKGKVGIGTTSPGQLLHLYGEGGTTEGNSNVRIRLESTAYDQYAPGIEMINYYNNEDHPNSPYDPGYVSKLIARDGMAFNFEWVPQGSCGGSTYSLMTLRPDGKVGIGTKTPVEQLEVDGAVNIGTTNNTNAGTIRWTGTDFQGYDGTSWLSLTDTGIGGSGTANRIPKFQTPTSLTDSQIYETGAMPFVSYGILEPNPVTTLDVNGGLATNTVYVNNSMSPYLVGPTDFLVLADTTMGPVTINLPPAATVDGQILSIKKIDPTGGPAGTVTITPLGGENIDGWGTPISFNTQWTTYTIQSSGADPTSPWGGQWYTI